MASRTSPGQITSLIRQWQDGGAQALTELLPLVYQELRSLASVYLSRERRDHTLDPTELVNETYLRLIRQGKVDADCRSHFYAATAQVMRRVLVEYARRGKAAKRGGGGPRPLTLVDQLAVEPSTGLDVLDIDRALEDLSVVDTRQAKLVELRYFGGMTMPEVAGFLTISVATAERDWTAARLWLRRRLSGRC